MEKAHEKGKATFLQKKKAESIAKTLHVPTADEEWNGHDVKCKENDPYGFYDPASEWYRLDPAPKEFVAEYLYRYQDAYRYAKEELWKLAAEKDTRLFCIYRHVSPSGKSYVGVTTQDPEDRWKSGYGYKNQGFWKAIKKYGWDNIEHYVYTEDGMAEYPLNENQTIKYVGLDEARSLEMEFIDEYDAYRNGYNCSEGGEIASELQALIEDFDYHHNETTP